MKASIALLGNLLIAFSPSFAVSKCKTVEPLDEFDIVQYKSKKWYSHQQREQPFTSQALFFCITAQYSFLDPTKVPFEPLGIENGFGIKVFNKGKDADGNVFTSDDEFAEGGFPVPSPLCAGQAIFDGDKDSQLTVGFCSLPAAASGPSNYWVLAYDEDEGATLIAGGQADVPNINGDGLCTYSSPFNGLWIFSRSPVRNNALINKYRGIARDNGIDPSMMKDVSQVDCDHTPEHNGKSPKNKKKKSPKSKSKKNKSPKLKSKKNKSPKLKSKKNKAPN